MKITFHIVLSERENEENTLIVENREKYLFCMEKMMFFLSHQIRQPIAHILGLSNLLDSSKKTPEEINEIISYMRQSAADLDKRSQHLSTFIYERVKTLKAMDPDPKIIL